MRLSKFQPFLALLCGVLLAVALLTPQPGNAKTATVRMARSTWETGWFQAEIVKQLIEDLGYDVSGPYTTETEDFYRAAARGDVDLWVNGWFPAHNTFLQQDEIGDRIVETGFAIERGVLQGYVVDLTTAERLDIENLEDLKDPEIARVFDRDGNGKADLIGCDESWSCREAIDHHLEVYGLQDTVEQISGNYVPLMQETIARYRGGDPVLFFAWMPHWSLGTLVPGQDVRWLEVPFFSLPDSLADTASSVPTLDNIVGCQRNPCLLGFSHHTIRAVANREFLQANPAVELLLALIDIPLEDIVAQNVKLANGEDELSDIVRHAREWIETHRDRVDRWLELASVDAEVLDRPPEDTDAAAPEPDKTLRVLTKPLEPLVIYRNQKYEGFCIELWEKIATELDLTYRLDGVGTIAKLLDDVVRGTTDLAIGGISITARREETLDFSYPFFESGLQIMVLERGNTLFNTLVSTLESIVFSPHIYYGIGVFVLTLLVVAHVIWIVERPHNPDFPQSYPLGIWESFWWAAVTVTTVGYGDKTPKHPLGKFVALVWMCAGYFVFAYFIATMTTSFTLDRLDGPIRSIDDLPGHRIATITRSTGAEYLNGVRATILEYDRVEDLYDALYDDRVDAIVYDAPVLQYYAEHEGNGRVQTVGSIFKRESYGFAFPKNSPYLEAIDITLLKLIENGTYEELRHRWFGEESWIAERTSSDPS
ncbi:glycine betaine/L-proline ABC transporter substrate-binding protein ProX [Baaleninema simplex]|uniref:glycine betaine/L-proline ABC transporter substrate-binding protein ProX n=1 Tax=Baaleninema simplex TaxID=2862350 RepID=UPI00034A59F2|nr:glycine betaine/L-proline ABC transporter substrate-binding protein ProX [Baaleninema simplex]